MSAPQFIPLNTLIESQGNGRRTDRKRHLGALAASIALTGKPSASLAAQH